MFANATKEGSALYFTVLGESPLKMLRYQQQFSFFDSSKVNESIHFANLGDLALQGDLTKTLETIMQHMSTRRCTRFSRPSSESAHATS